MMHALSHFTRRARGPVLALSASIGLASAAQAQTDVGVSVNIAQPGFYGRIDIGNQPPPALIYAQPVIIQQTPVAVQQRPIYMHVPPGHYKHWAKYCGFYRACGQRVYFVRELPRQYVPDHRHEWHERRDWQDDDHRGRGPEHGYGGPEHDHGHGNGHGHGHGHGH